MKLNCLVIDDEPVARDILKDYITDVDFLTLVGMAENPIKASLMLEGNSVDLLFLDINMPKMNGIEFLRLSKSLPSTVLTTAYAEYSLDGFELNVLDFLLKPFSFNRFLKAAFKAKEHHEKMKLTNNLAEQGSFFVKCDGRIEKIRYEELVCVEAMENYVVLHTITGKRIAYLTLKMMEEQLPKSFIKIHKSMIINLQKVKSIYGKTVDLGTMQCAISQNLFEDVMQEILQGRLLKR